MILFLFEIRPSVNKFSKLFKAELNSLIDIDDPSTEIATLIDWHILDFYSATAEWILMKLDGKQMLNFFH